MAARPGVIPPVVRPAARVCHATASTRDNSGTFHATNDRGLAGKRLTAVAELWIDASSIARGWLSDGARTADCSGRTGRGVRCFS